MTDFNFHLLNSNLLFTKNDPSDARLGDKAQAVVSFEDVKSTQQVLISGSCDDEGIALNGGRLGASFAPDVIREFLYKMTYPLEDQNHELNFKQKCLLDFGNFRFDALSLEERHQHVRSWANKATELNSRWIHVGGGHDYGFPSSAGFVDSLLKADSKRKPIIINFDAHLDVRSSDKGLNSGTPFYRLLNEFGDKIEFYEVGIQPQCNSVHHIEWVKNRGGFVYFYDQLDDFYNHIVSKTNQPLFISLDIDMFTIAEAPGCSQSWPLGVSVRDFFSIYKEILKSHDIRALGLYEFSPRWDESSKTAKLAALILYYFIFGKTLI